MRLKTPHALAIAFVLVVLGFVGLKRQGPEMAEAPPLGTAEPRPRETFALPVSPDRGLSEALAEREPVPSDVIADELVALFSSDEALRGFLEEARRSGLQVIDVDERLRAARLWIRSVDESRLARSMADAESSFEFNRTVLTPWPVDGTEVKLGPGFGAAALASMGVPQDNASWGEGVKIAILDTGVLPHSSLSDVSIETLDLVDLDGEPSPIAPHGTAVASLLAGQGGAGIAPAAELISIRVLDSDGIGDSFTVAKGIVEAVDRGAEIINLSLGGFGPSETLRLAVEYARDRGVALVASAGNESLETLPYPAEYDGVLAVAAVDSAGRHAPFSNRSDGVGIAAPGVEVYAAWGGDQWVALSGTSVASPLVAGSVAALMSQREGMPALAAVEELLATASDVGMPGADLYTGSGLADLDRAMSGGQPGIYDMALADIYLSPFIGPDGSALVYVSAQNRGTETVSESSLSIVDADGFPRTVYLGPLQPGEVKAHAIEVPSSALETDSGYVLRASVSAAIDDARPANNQREAALRSP